MAANVTLRTAKQNKVQIEAVLSDLLSGCKLHKKVDVLLFNPPYVVTPSEEVGSLGIEAAWAGGIDGREVIDRLLPKVDDLVSPTGCFYMVVIKENRPAEIMEFFNARGFYTSVVASRRAGPEFLSVLKFSRTQ
eukprot:Colp12_sorted_trinity150504_noHs@29150